MRLDTYGLLCMIAGLVTGVIIEYLRAPWYVNFTLGLTCSLVMLSVVPRIWRINADQ